MTDLIEYYSKQFGEDFWQFILDNPDKDWDWYQLSCNKNITWDIKRNN